MKDPAGCCLTDPSPPRDNPPGEPRIAYRIGTHGTFFARMIEALGRTGVADVPDTRPLRALTTRALDDGSIALCDAWAVTLDVLTFYQERIANEGYLGTAQERRSIVELARSIGYEPGPGVAASTHLAFTVDPNAPGGIVRLPAGLAVTSVPGQDERPQTFETAEELEARLEWNELRPSPRAPRADATTRTLYVEGAATRLKLGDPIAILEAPGGRLVDLRFVTSTTPRPEYDLVEVTLDEDVLVPAAAMVVIFRWRASVFGHAAPDPRLLSLTGVTLEGTPLDWTGMAVAAGATSVALDREYPEVVAGGWILVQDGAQLDLRRVDSATPTGQRDFTLVAKCTLVEVAAPALRSFHRRSAVVYLQGEEHELARRPLLPTAVMPAGAIELDREVAAMPVGRLVMVTGLDAASRVPVAATAAVGGWDTRVDPPRSVLVLREPLDLELAQTSVVVLGNVAVATHGASTSEILGSGEAALANQRFVLKQVPLTWVPARTATGSESTLEVRVDAVLWRRVDSLLDQGPNDRVYVLRTDDDGSTHVQFGDGLRGARLPTGAGNVAARYRVGLGLEGELEAGRLTLLQQRPLGLRAASNPTPATGAGDRESLAAARRNAPLTVLTLDRLVAVQDYEDFARAFAGVGKSAAVDLWQGKRAFVHLTIASASGEVFEDGAPTLRALTAAIDERNDPGHQVVISPHVERRFGIEIQILRDLAYTVEAVEAAVRAALAGAFGFATRQFGQPVSTTEITAVVQAVDGVVAIDIDDLFYVGTAGRESATGPVLPAARAQWDGTRMTRSELLLLDSASVFLGRMER